MIVEAVCKTHRAIDNKSAVKLPAAAREDLVARIDAAIGEKHEG